VTRQFQAAIGELPFDGGAAFWAVHCPGLRCRSNVHIGASTKKIFVDTTVTQKCTVATAQRTIQQLIDLMGVFSELTRIYCRTAKSLISPEEVPSNAGRAG
jgi:hypothetical protein